MLSKTIFVHIFLAAFAASPFLLHMHRKNGETQAKLIY